MYVNISSFLIGYAYRKNGKILNVIAKVLTDETVNPSSVKSAVDQALAGLMIDGEAFTPCSANFLGQ